MPLMLPAPCLTLTTQQGLEHTSVSPTGMSYGRPKVLQKRGRLEREASQMILHRDPR